VAARRDFGLDLFMDRERLRVRALFGSLTDDAFVSTRPDAAAAGLVGGVAFLWAGAVLHVRAAPARRRAALRCGMPSAAGVAGLSHGGRETVPHPVMRGVHQEGWVPGTRSKARRRAGGPPRAIGPCAGGAGAVQAGLGALCGIGAPAVCARGHLLRDDGGS